MRGHSNDLKRKTNIFVYFWNPGSPSPFTFFFCLMPNEPDPRLTWGTPDACCSRNFHMFRLITLLLVVWVIFLRRWWQRQWLRSQNNRDLLFTQLANRGQASSGTDLEVGETVRCHYIPRVLANPLSDREECRMFKVQARGRNTRGRLLSYCKERPDTVTTSRHKQRICAGSKHLKRPSIRLNRYMNWELHWCWCQIVVWFEQSTIPS